MNSNCGGSVLSFAYNQIETDYFKEQGLTICGLVLVVLLAILQVVLTFMAFGYYSRGGDNDDENKLDVGSGYNNLLQKNDYFEADNN